MKRLVLALILLLGSVISVAAQERQIIDRGVVINRDALVLGTSVELVFEGTTNDGNEFTIASQDVDADWTLTFPANDGTSGQQLQTDGSGVTVWASAGSTRDMKRMAGLLSPTDALAAVLSAPIHRFRYKPGMGTQDSTTDYAGIVAEEAPWAMHFDGTILNPVNTVGYAFASIQALHAEIEALKAQIAARRPHRTWRTLWLIKE